MDEPQDIVKRKAREIMEKLNLKVKDELKYSPSTYVSHDSTFSVMVKNQNILNDLRWNESSKAIDLESKHLIATSKFDPKLLLEVVSFLEGMKCDCVTLRMGNDYPIVIETEWFDIMLAPKVYEDERPKIEPKHEPKKSKKRSK